MEVPNTETVPQQTLKLFDTEQQLYLEMHVYSAGWYKWASRAKPDLSFKK